MSEPSAPTAPVDVAPPVEPVEPVEPVGVVPPGARRVLRGAAVLAAVLIIVSFFLSPAPMSVMWGLGLGASAIGFVWFVTAERRRFMTPVVFAVFYLLGYIVSFAGMIRDPASVPRVGYTAIGRFSFTDDDFSQVAAFIAAGLVGIVIAVFLAEALIPKSRTSGLWSRFPVPAVVTSWAVLSAGLIGTCAALGLGRTGLNNETALPFALGGLLVYLRTYFLPPMGVFVLDLVARRKSTPLLLTVLGLMLAFAVVGSLAAMSRGFFVTAMSPTLFLLLRRDQGAAWFRRRALPAVVVSVLVSGIVMTAIGSLRSAGYATGEMSVSESADVLQQAPDGDSEGSGLEHVATLATERVGGMSQLLAVSGCRVRGFEPMWGLAVEGGQWTDRITLDSMGFVPRQDRTAAFGVGFGFWGTLAVTDSVPLVLVFTTLLLLLPLLTEAAFGAIRQRTMGHVVAALMCLMLWGQPTLFDMSRFVFIVVLTFVVVVLLTKKAPDAKGDSTLAQDDEHVGAERGERL